MKKVKHYVSALLMAGVLFSMPSCVDDNESSSVTAVREAYANQLKAQGELAKAQAESAKIKVDAEIALLKAQEEQAKAKTKLDEANAALIIAQTDIEKKKAVHDQAVAAEELKALQLKTQLEMEEFKVKLAQLQVAAELEMLNLQRELDKAKNQKDPVLEKAINDYKLLALEINSLKNGIASGELDQAYDKAVLDNMKASLQADTDNSLKMFAMWTADAEFRLKRDQQNLSSWNLLLKDIDLTKIEAEITTKTKEYQALLVKRTSVYTKYNEQRLVFENGAKKNLVDFQTLMGKNYTSVAMPYNRTYYTLAEVNSNIVYATNEMTSYQSDIDAYNKKLALSKAQLNTLLKNKVDKEVILNKAIEAQTAAWQAYYNNSTSENYNKAQAADMAYYVADSAYDTARYAYDDAIRTIEDAEYYINRYTNYLNSAKYDLEKYNLQKAAYTKDAGVVKTLTDAYLAAEKVYNESYKAYEQLNVEIQSLGNYITELNKIYYSPELDRNDWGDGNITSGTIDYVKSLIKSLEYEVSKNQALIQKYKRDATDVKELNKKASAELDLRIATRDADIKRMKLELQIAEKDAAAAKKIMDERMK